MNKNNRILLKIVAILLCLVLITTCVVSSTLARFVIKKSGSVPIKFDKFGVTMKVSSGEDNVRAKIVSDGKGNSDAKSFTITYDTIEMYPSYAMMDSMVFVTFNGTLNVPATLEVTVDVTLDEDIFYISSDDFQGLTSNSANKSYIPMRFLAGTAKSTESTSMETYKSAVSEWTQADKGKLGEEIEKKICQYFYDMVKINSTAVAANGSGYCVTKNFAKGYEFKNNPEAADGYTPPFGDPNTADKLNYGCGFGLGVKWPSPSNSTSNQERMAMMTWIADKAAEKQEANANYVPMKITITISLEQTGT